LVYNISDKKNETADFNQMLIEGDFDLSQYIDDITKRIVIKALDLNNWNIKKTSEVLKLNYRSLRYLMEKFHIKER